MISIHLVATNYLLVFKHPYEYLSEEAALIFEKEISHDEYGKIMEILKPFEQMTFNNGKLISVINDKGSSTEQLYDYSNFK